MDNETRELLASITARLDTLSMNMHEDARETALLKTAATKLRTGVRPAVVLAELDPRVRWHHVGA
jgi:hypothetical protein